MKASAPLVPPAVVTVTLRAPAAAPLAIVNVVVSDVVLAVVTVPTVTPTPSTLTVVAPAAKFVPVRVTLAALPAVPVDGEIPERVGATGDPGADVCDGESAPPEPPHAVTSAASRAHCSTATHRVGATW